MVTIAALRASSRIMASAGVLAVLSIWHAPVRAQQFTVAVAQQSLGPDASEFQPTPGVLRSTSFGAQIARHRNTVLIQEAGFFDADNRGRVAVFTRNAAGTWVRTGSIDAPDPQPFDYFGMDMAISDDVALIRSLRGVYVFRRVHQSWQTVQILRPKETSSFSELAIWHNWVFIGGTSNGEGVVRVYLITHRGFLVRVQTLHSASGDPADGFGDRLAISDGALLVGAASDNDGRGAAYVFERRGVRWLKRQKLVAIDGASGDVFGSAVAIDDHRIAIGASGLQSARDASCLGGGSSGAVYVFSSVHGTWLQQQVIEAADAQDSPPQCIDGFGANVVVSGRWLVATSPSAYPDFFGHPVIFRAAHGQYTPVAHARGTDVILTPLQLSGRTLFVGLYFEHGAIFEGSIGSVEVYRLDEAIP